MGKKKPLPGSAKALSNQMKKKNGLNKLKFYCQVCEKSCRDANGYKCHSMSEAHIQKMKLFAADSGRFIQEFSSKFENEFLDMLMRKHHTNRVNANHLYNDYIQDRHHVHMNSTQWTSLSQFVQHLGETKKCVVDQDETGMYIRWIDPNAATLSSASPSLSSHSSLQNVKRRKRKSSSAAVKDEEEQNNKSLEKEIELASKLGRETTETVKASDPIALQSSSSSSSSSSGPSLSISMKSNKKRRFKMKMDEDEEDEQENERKDQKGECGIDDKNMAENEKHEIIATAGEIENGKKKELNKINETTKSKEREFEKKDTWLQPGLFVKVVSKKVHGGKVYGKKGIVEHVQVKQQDALKEVKFKAALKMLNSNESVTVKESQVETVIPRPGKMAMVVSSKNSSAPNVGEIVKIVEVKVKQFACVVELSSGEQTLLEYENICKFEKKKD